MENLLAPVRSAYTDDEVVALTMAAEVQWARAMVSVDLMNPQEIAKAEFRGRRALALRDFSDELVDGEPMPVVVAGQEPAVIIALVDSELLVEPNAMRVEIYPHGAGLIECGSLPNGTHLFLHKPEADLAQRVADLLTVKRADNTLATIALFRSKGGGSPQGLLAGANCQLITFAPLGPERHDLGVGLSEQQWLDQAGSLC